ncbi:SAM-dependent DNA methyltransferase (plasmid) [Azospirillum baldaniorum]|uniref:site-specific DNA-methyltransferase (adenine-specific) n=1 Tax=Azospirillum baldaniorum TaxID=1064539 RepID=A0A9P1JXV0_9PROT|nr:N-6 DNA methylase [Azospirillum baldaniorum]AWJ93675.1 SAM-dependent DNA methyltransferase [Azospirillum baldaniorum]TWA82228.1 N-6 DNA methylase [Azospirillum brasilense]CCD01748.1 protein of unknown function [Azospirillum baldaniorum]
MNADDLVHRLDALCELLGYSASSTFLTSADVQDGRPLPHAIREALRTIGVSGVFAMKDGSATGRLKAVVYVATAVGEDDVHRLRKEVWTQGVVPFLVIVMIDRVLVCSGFEPPSRNAHVVRGELLQNHKLAQLSAERLRSSITWQDFDITASSKVDDELLAAIQELSKQIRQDNIALKDRPDLVSALIGRFLYLYVLIDRGIVSQRWLDNTVLGGRGVRNFISDALSAARSGGARRWGRNDAFVVFDALDAAINGSVFPIVEADRTLLDDESCRLIHCVLRAGEKLKSGGRQLSFFDISYRVIRTETISALYERFVALKGLQPKKDKGVFYTPPCLADHVLDRIEETAPLDRNSRLLDPAAGSGIFLVGAFRRIMERHAPAGGWRLANLHEARALLTDCIHGIEELPEAANVCRFSLYLTLLDYVGQVPIEALREAFGEEKFLPSLSDNIYARDAFSNPFGSRRFTHVVGNPPWSQEGGQKDRTNQTRDKKASSAALEEFKKRLDGKAEPVGHNRLADLFFWLGTRLAEEGATLGFVMPARSLIGKHSNGFAKAVAARTTPTFIGNLAHLRRKLFDGAEAAACLVITRNRAPDRDDKVSIYRPLLSSLPLGKNFPIWLLPAGPTDIQAFLVRDLREGAAGWFEQAMLSALDRRTLRALSTWTSAKALSLSDFLDRSNLVMHKGLSPAYTGVERRKVDGRTEQISPLTAGELDRIPANYRARFAGDVVLLPRTPGQLAIHLAGPHQFPSTFNVIHPAERDSPTEDETTGPREKNKAWCDAVPALLAYFNSGLVNYFSSLYAPTYLIDAMRFERDDLLQVPCPFRDLTDPNLLAIGDAVDVDEAILDAMGAGDEFRSAFREFQSFRKDFGNAQVPESAFEEPNDGELRSYLARLQAELEAAGNVGGRATCEAPLDTKIDGRRNVTILIGGASRNELPPPPSGGFLGASSVAVSNSAQAAVLVKSVARYAWTVEQAVADAAALRSDISKLQRMRR